MQKALARLRYKTDQELFILTEKQLEQTLRLAQVGQTAEALRSLGFARRMLAVARLSYSQRARIDDRMAAIEAALRVEEPCTAVA